MFQMMPSKSPCCRHLHDAAWIDTQYEDATMRPTPPVTCLQGLEYPIPNCHANSFPKSTRWDGILFKHYSWNTSFWLAIRHDKRTVSPYLMAHIRSWLFRIRRSDVFTLCNPHWFEQIIVIEISQCCVPSFSPSPPLRLQLRLWCSKPEASRSQAIQTPLTHCMRSCRRDRGRHQDL